MGIKKTIYTVLIGLKRLITLDFRSWGEKNNYDKIYSQNNEDVIDFEW